MTQPEKRTLDFLVIGAQKSGTTSLFEYLRRHPEICLPLDKEAPYFSHNVEMQRGWSNYMERTFPDSDATCKWGTVTPHYMAGGVWDASTCPADDGPYNECTVPERIRAHLPDARLIAILRNPVERAASHHKMALMKGLERRTFDQAIAQLLRPEELERSRASPAEANSYVTWGEYARILAGYLEVFPREQILIVFNDALEQEPAELLQQMHEFIGVAPSIMPENLSVRYRKGNNRLRLAWLIPGSVHRSVERNPLTRSLWQALPTRTRRRIGRRFAQLSYRVDLWNQRDSGDKETPRPATIARLHEHFVHDGRHLASLLDVEVPWLTTYDEATSIAAR